MSNIKRFLPFGIVIAFAFYVLPFIIKDTGSAMFVLLIILPIVNFIVGVVFGAKFGFHWFLPIIVALLFIPTIFIFYNSSAWGYSPAYGVINLAGIGIGTLFQRKKR